MNETNQVAMAEKEILNVLMEAVRNFKTTIDEGLDDIFYESSDRELDRYRKIAAATI